MTCKATGDNLSFHLSSMFTVKNITSTTCSLPGDVTPLQKIADLVLRHTSKLRGKKLLPHVATIHRFQPNYAVQQKSNTNLESKLLLIYDHIR